MIANIAQTFETLSGRLVDVVHNFVLRHGKTGRACKGQGGNKLEDAIHEAAPVEI